MNTPMTRLSEHSITVDAPARAVYGLIADVTQWPVIFPPTVHVEYVERGPAGELIRIWASANGTVKGWTSRRELDPDRMRVRFRQEVPAPPVAAMSGEWVVTPVADNRALVLLTHEFRAADDDAGRLAWIEQAVDRNSTAELAALAAAAAAAAAARPGREELSLSFADEIRVDGAASDVYDFIDEAGRWPARLPHVVRAELTEDIPGIQVLEMDTRTGDGATHTTRSARICFPHHQIVYKQLRTPALLSVHTGRWQFSQQSAVTLLSSAHTVVLIPQAIPAVLGPAVTLEDAMSFVRAALSRNSMATMLAAKEYAQRRALVR